MTYGLDRASFNQGKNAKFSFSILDEIQPTLTERGPGAICSSMSVHFAEMTTKELTTNMSSRTKLSAEREREYGVYRKTINAA